MITKQDILKIASIISRQGLKDSSFEKMTSIGSPSDVQLSVLHDGKNKLLELKKVIDLITLKPLDVAKAEIEVSWSDKKTLLGVLNDLWELASETISPEDLEGLEINLGASHVTYTNGGYTNISDAVDDLLGTIAGVISIDENTGVLPYDKLPGVVLHAVLDPEESTQASGYSEGELYAIGTSLYIHHTSDTDTSIGNAVPGVLYYSIADNSILYISGGSWAYIEQEIPDDFALLEFKNHISYNTLPHIILNNITGQRAGVRDAYVFYPSESQSSSFNSTITLGTIAYIDSTGSASPIRLTPSKGLIYYCMADSKLYRFDGSKMVEITSGGGGGASVTVDSALSLSSTNPVENRVVYQELNKKYEKPTGGIPATDLASGIQTALSKVSTLMPKDESQNDGSGDAFGSYRLKVAFERMYDEDQLNLFQDGFVYYVNSGTHAGQFMTPVPVTSGNTQTTSYVYFYPIKGALYYNKQNKKFYTYVREQNSMVMREEGTLGSGGGGGIINFSVTTDNQGNITITAGDDEYTINLNHTHDQYINSQVISGTSLPATVDDNTMYILVGSSTTKLYFGNRLLCESTANNS